MLAQTRGRLDVHRECALLAVGLTRHQDGPIRRHRTGDGTCADADIGDWRKSKRLRKKRASVLDAGDSTETFPSKVGATRRVEAALVVPNAHVLDGGENSLESTLLDDEAPEKRPLHQLNPGSLNSGAR